MADGRRYEKYSNRTAAVGCGGCDAAQCYRYCSNLLRCTVADFEGGGVEPAPVPLWATNRRRHGTLIKRQLKNMQ